jgi:neutral ceramidase
MLLLRSARFQIRHDFLFVGLILFATAAGILEAADSPAGKVLRAGAYAEDITPLKFPIGVNGGMRDQQAASAHDPLHARALVLDNGAVKLAIVVCDSCALPRTIMDEAKNLAAQATGIPVENQLISATHTHEAPTAVSVFQSDPDPEYVTFLTQQIAKAIQKAHANLTPAQIAWGVGKDPTQVFNRRWKMKPGTMPLNPWGDTSDKVKMNPGRMNPGLIEPAGPTDPEVSILAVRTREGRPISVLANYSLHYVGGVPPLSADYFGEFAKRIGRLVGADNSSPAFVGIMSNGTSGDINNVNFKIPEPPRKAAFKQIEIVAESVAQAAYAAYQQLEFKDWVPLAVSQKEIELGVRRPSDDEVAKAKEYVAKLEVLKSLQEVYARETIKLADYAPTVKARLQAMRIGDLGIVSSPCETFVETGLAIKRESPLKPTFVIELANGYNGYLPTPEQHELGGYETWRARSSYLAVDAETKIRATLLELLKEVAVVK